MANPLTRALSACLRSDDPELVHTAKARLREILVDCRTELERAEKLGLSRQKWFKWRQFGLVDYPVKALDEQAERLDE